MFEKMKSWFNEYLDQIVVTLGMSVIAAIFLSFLYWDHNNTEKENRRRFKESQAAFSKAKNPGDIVKLKMDGTKIIIVQTIYHFDTKRISYQVKKDSLGAAFEVYEFEVVDTDAEVKPFAY